MKAFKPDGSRWFARTLPELLEEWAVPLCVSVPAVPPSEVITLDVVINAGRRATEQAVTRMRALQARLDRMKEDAVLQARSALQQWADAPPNRHERRALRKNQSPTHMLPQKGRPRHVGAGARRVRR